MNQYTQYADDYLSGYNNIPVGVLDNAEFKQEVIRLSGYTPPTPEQIISHNKRVNRDIKTIQNMVKSLLGPKGGKPKSGKALSDYKNLVHNLNILQANIW
jgi:hypothetical protein